VKRSFLLATSLCFALACPKEEAPVAAVQAAPPPVDPEAWRAKMPEPGAEVSWSAPVAREFKLSNGVPVYLVENPSLPLITVQVVLSVGREANPKGKEGLAALTASMLDEGTKKRGGAELAAAADSLGMDLSVGSSTDLSWVSMDALTGEALAPSLDLLTEVLLQPRFDAKDFARVRQEQVDGILAARAEPRDVAQRTLARALYGADHPYGTPAVGKVETVQKLTVKDASALYADRWHAGAAAIAISGAVTQAEIQPLLEARLGKWRVGKSGRVVAPPPNTPSTAQVIFVEQPGAVQSVIVAATPGPNRSSVEWIGAEMAGTLFAGMFSSRLNMNLREEHGWSYGAYGSFVPARDHGLFSARTSVQADKTAPAVTEIIKEMNAARRAPKPEELKLTQDNLVKSLPGNFQTNRATAEAFGSALALQMGADVWKKLPEQYMGTSPETMGAASTRYFDPARMTFVVVGPRSIEVEEGGQKKSVDVVAELKALGFAFREEKADSK
jgi:zinc protease